MFKSLLKVAAASALLFFVTLPSSAQALAQARGQAPATDSQSLEPAPRWPDGRVNLGSTSDKKGYWEVRPGLGGFPRAADVPLQPWARALYQYRNSRTDLYPPLVGCKPGGGPAFFNAPGFEIVDVPELKSVFILNIAGPHSWRVIHMDGRPHPTGDDLRPTYLGHSTGKWEGDTLVIDSVGFNEKQWLNGAYPSTNQLHLIERISRPNLKTLAYEVTVDDPGAYTTSWSGRWTITEKTASSWMAGGEIFEYICQDDGK
ncbi:MAG TPA: hypothetical protein VE422_32915 [Terriglobia bacterium]|nr:hypothetical protein [Terriglobia bacterium]